MLQWVRFFKQFTSARQAEQQRAQLDVLLSAARPESDLAERLQWIARFLQWLRHESVIETQPGEQYSRLPVARIRFFMRVLDRNPKWRSAVGRTFRYTLRDVRATELFCETGLPTELSLIGEVWDRVIVKLLPPKPFGPHLSESFIRLFPTEHDASWVETIDPATFQSIIDLIKADMHPFEPEWDAFAADMREALMYLVSQIVAIGLSPAIRARLDSETMRLLPFFPLSRLTTEFIDELITNEDDKSAIKSSADILIQQLYEIERISQIVMRHLDEFGVSVALVYQLEKLHRYCQRCAVLIQILSDRNFSSVTVTNFLANLISENTGRTKIRSLLRQTSSLLAQKVVDRNSEVGEHYITRSASDYLHLLQKALGGGMVTAGTVFLKIFIGGMGLPLFTTGIITGFNYAVSFVFIQLAGFTLGTKQAAATAPALASRMHDLNEKDNQQALVDEVVNLIRSQFISIVGNVIAVLPTAFLLNAIFTLGFHYPLVSDEKAHHIVADLDILGPTALYGAFTGIVLWLSSMFAGWADNFFVFWRLDFSIRHHSTLRLAFGEEGAGKIADFFKNNVAGLSGNISLGFLLALTPHILRMFDIPLDVRHVTLSSGNLAAALPVLGLPFLTSPEFFRAVLGIASIGVLNVMVSFYCAFNVAIRAKSLKGPEKQIIYKALWERFRRRPHHFILPPRS